MNKNVSYFLVSIFFPFTYLVEVVVRFIFGLEARESKPVLQKSSELNVVNELKQLGNGSTKGVRLPKLNGKPIF